MKQDMSTNGTATKLERLAALKQESGRIGLALIIMLSWQMFLPCLAQLNYGAQLSVCLTAAVVFLWPLILKYYPKTGLIFLFLFLSFIFSGLLIKRPINASISIFSNLIVGCLLMYLSEKKTSLRFLSAIVPIILAISLYQLFFYRLSDFLILHPDVKDSVIFIQVQQFIWHFFTCALPFLFLLTPQETAHLAPHDEILKFKPVPPAMLLAFLGVGMATAMFANFLTTMLHHNLDYIGIHYIMPDTPSGTSPMEMFLAVFVIAVEPAIVEEFVFRGVILGRLRKYGDFFAVFLSSLLFGIFHMNIDQFAFAFILGLILGVLVIETNSIWPSMLIHFLNNFYAECGTLVQNYFGAQISGVYHITCLLIFVIGGIFGLIYITKRKPNFLGNNNRPLGLLTGECVKASFKSIRFSLAFAIMVLFTIMVTCRYIT
jgi:membrane protease YdiL (CAAX protease family)